MTAGTSSAGAAPTMMGQEDRDLVITRVFDAPRELVWRAWTVHEHLVRWSAPHGFTIPESESKGEVRPGGHWRSCMISPDGVEHRLGGVYREVVPVERLSFTHAWEGEDGRPGHETLVSVTFAADGEGKTRMTFRQTGFKSDASRNGHREGWEESFDRLAALVDELS